MSSSQNINHPKPGQKSYHSKFDKAEEVFLRMLLYAMILGINFALWKYAMGWL